MGLIGLSSAEIEERRARYGSNSLTQLERDSLWKKVLQGFKDPMIMILLVALIIQGVLYFMGQAEWFEPVGILVAILIANGVASISEYRQEGKAVALRNDEAAKDMTKVLRDGHFLEIPVGDVVNGDVIFLQAGDRLPTDGLLIEGAVHIDQSVLNGETEEIYKTPLEDGESSTYEIDDLLNPHYAYRGTVVCSGEGYLETNVVGDKTLFGQLALEAQSVARRTPLQVKLDKLARHISTFGYVGAIAIVVGILIKTVVTGELPASMWEWVRLIIDAVTVAVTVIVCAVPEGLPMLTSMLLSVQSLKMEKDNVLVKKINGIETSGSLSILFSDKTGTITEGKLSVVDIALGDLVHLKHIGNLELKSNEGREASGEYLDKFIKAAGLNNSAHAGTDSVIGGNSTDRSIIKALMDAGLTDSINRDEALGFKYFNSRDKYSAVAVKEDDKCICYLKGAPEVMLEKCHQYLGADGSLHTLNTVTEIKKYIDNQASRSMRLLAVAYGVGHVNENGEAE
ncbi:cation-transporting P-type ATPase, partial [Anaerovibrio sp.]|uniref:P-type ATPase n=1 Tax=Anaerovibrio sp. TaxID=1872532 RepID=UPI0038902E1B